MADQADKEDDELAAILGVPIWNHGMLEQATLTPVRHAVHLVRYLNDYNVPTVAALRWQRLRKLRDMELDVRLNVCLRLLRAFWNNRPGGATW